MVGPDGRGAKFQAKSRTGNSVVNGGGCTCAAPRLRQSLAALGSGYGLNEEGIPTSHFPLPTSQSYPPSLNCVPLLPELGVAGPRAGPPVGSGEKLPAGLPAGGGDDGRAGALNPPVELPAEVSGAGLLALVAGSTEAGAGLLIAGPKPVAGGSPKPGACADGAVVLAGGNAKPLLGLLSIRAGAC
jgi:hypothetical protein